MNGQKHTTIVDLLNRHANTRSGLTAVTYLAGQDGDVNQSFTYAQLDRHACALAVALLETAKAGDRALILCPSGLPFVQAIVGCFYSGIIAVPAYPPSNAKQTQRIDLIWRDAEAALIITTTAVKLRIEQWLSAELRETPFRFLCVDSIDLHVADAWRRPNLAPDSLAFLQYTSGSTSEPKGVMVSHANLLANLEMIRRRFGLHEDTVVGSWLPVFHDMGLVGDLLEPLYLGAQTVKMSPVDFIRRPVRWLEMISRYPVTVAGSPNFGYALCVDNISAEQCQGLDLSRLQIAYCGAEPIDYRVLDRFAERFAPCGFRREMFYPCYGMAETTLLVTGGIAGTAPAYFAADVFELEQHQQAVAAEQPARVLVGCGYSVDNQQLKIVDTETQQALAEGHVGEIWVHGPHVAQGYWRNAELTQTMFHARLTEGDDTQYLRTGDLGFMRDGNLYVTGRIKDMMIVRGRNYYPQDIERTALQSHPALQAAGAAAFTIPAATETLIALAVEVRRAAMRQLPAETIVQHIRHAVAEEHELALAAIVLLKPASLPKTSSGKVRRSACRAAFLAQYLEVLHQWAAPAVPDAAPTSIVHPLCATTSAPDAAGIAQWLREWIAVRMGQPVNAIAPERAFADFGLDSMTALELAEQLQQWLGISIASTVTWDFPNIQALAEHLAQESQQKLAVVNQQTINAPEGINAEALDELSDSELASLLAGELNLPV